MPSRGILIRTLSNTIRSKGCCGSVVANTLDQPHHIALGNRCDWPLAPKGDKDATEVTSNQRRRALARLVRIGANKLDSRIVLEHGGEGVGSRPEFGLPFFFLSNLRVDAFLDEFFPALGLLSGLCKSQFRVGTQATPCGIAAAGIPSHQNEGSSPRFRRSDAEAMDIGIPSVEMAHKAGVWLEAIELPICKIPPNYHRSPLATAWQQKRCASVLPNVAKR